LGKLVVTYSVGPDTTPPADVSAFTATPGDGHVILNWTNPTDSDFAGTIIRCRTDGTYPVNYDDGTLVCDKAAASGSEDSCTHTEGVENGTTYYYSAFTYDEVPNYSETAHASATPTAAGPPLDTIDPTVGITSPTAGTPYSTEEDTISLVGSASDDVGVTSVLSAFLLERQKAISCESCRSCLTTFTHFTSRDFWVIFFVFNST
jgi:hypothetical protein